MGLSCVWSCLVLGARVADWYGLQELFFWHECTTFQGISRIMFCSLGWFTSLLDQSIDFSPDCGVFTHYFAQPIAWQDQPTGDLMLMLA